MTRQLAAPALALALIATGCSGDPEPERPQRSEAPAAVLEIGAWHDLAADPAGGVLLVNGHPETATDPAPVGLWRWDGKQWAAVEPAGEAPSARNFAAIAMDTDRDVLLLHGGVTPDGPSDETWAWDGTEWSLVASGPDGPGPRASPSMAYDAANARTLLYGGDDGAEQFNDTWAWDGEAWAQLTEDGPTPVRWPGSMEYDPVSEGVVMFGGHQVVDEDAPIDLGDTWVWSDNRWRAVPGAGQPGRLVNANGVAHPTLGLLLVGGASEEGGDSGRVWTWTGSAWDPLPPGLVPDRQAFGLAYDAERAVVVLTGGVVEPGSTERHQDVWEWSGDPGTPAVRVSADE